MPANGSLTAHPSERHPMLGRKVQCTELTLSPGTVLAARHVSLTKTSPSAESPERSQSGVRRDPSRRRSPTERGSPANFDAAADLAG
jgi:hypothetical protein